MLKRVLHRYSKSFTKSLFDCIFLGEYSTGIPNLLPKVFLIAFSLVVTAIAAPSAFSAHA